MQETTFIKQLLGLTLIGCAVFGCTKISGKAGLEMTCSPVKVNDFGEKGAKGEFWRCANSEVICYTVGAGFSCIPK